MPRRGSVMRFGGGEGLRAALSLPPLLPGANTMPTDTMLAVLADRLRAGVGVCTTGSHASDWLLIVSVE